LCEQPAGSNIRVFSALPATLKEPRRLKWLIEENPEWLIDAPKAGSKNEGKDHTQKRLETTSTIES